MQDILTWGALIAAGGSIIAIITFWMNRGRAEAEACAKAAAAATTAGVALSKAEHASVLLAETRIEFARDYASHKDLSASEMRFAGAVDSMRTELRGMNERLDRIIEKFVQHA
jgi:signal transduction protein with GAF and PtsI domain